MKGGKTNIWPVLNRRGFVVSAAAATLVAASPLSAATPPRDPRLVVILRRGAPDGGMGWLNRAAEALRGMGRARCGNLIAIGSHTPSILHGAAPTLVCAPGALQCIDPERLVEHLDERGALKRSVVIAAPLVYGAATPPVSFPTREARPGIQGPSSADSWIPAPPPAVGNDTFRNASAIGRALAATRGMRIGVIESDNLSDRDCVVTALAQEMESVWRDTVIIVAGAARPALLVGGAVRNWRMVDGTGLHSVYANVLRDHFEIPPELLEQKVFSEPRLGKDATLDQTHPPSTT